MRQRVAGESGPGAARRGGTLGGAVPEAPPTADAAPAREVLNLRWLLWLRWTAAALLLASAVGLSALGSSRWSDAALAAAVVASGAVLLRARARRGSSPLVLLALIGDAALLTAMLTRSGGAANPFSGLYLFLVLIGALALRRRGAWALLAVCGAAYAALFTLPGSEHAHHAVGLQSHLVGMLLVFALLGPSTVLAVTSLRRELERFEEEAAEAAALRHRNERLSSLATLVAGAAHELNTPLGTISVVAHELRRRVTDPEGQEDLALIGEEIDRCIAVLDQMSADAGRIPGEAFQPSTTAAVVEAALSRLADAGRVRVDLAPELGEERLRLPGRQVARALRGVLDNALRAGDGDVELIGRRDAGGLRFEVRDTGAGMPREVLARAGEPFFTTRPAGQGMGLGLYFARSLAEGLGGGLTLESTPGHGTRATLRLPPAAPENEDAADV